MTSQAVPPASKSVALLRKDTLSSDMDDASSDLEEEKGDYQSEGEEEGEDEEEEDEYTNNLSVVQPSIQTAEDPLDYDDDGRAKGVKKLLELIR